MLKLLNNKWQLISLGILTAICSLKASAESLNEEKWYQVDMLLVAYTNKTTIGNESWPVMLTPTEDSIENDATAIIDTTGQLDLDEKDTSTPTVEETYEWVEWWNQPYKGGLEVAENQQLGRPFAINSRTSFDYEANNINRQNGMQVIWKGSWQQDTQSKDLTEIIKVDAQLDQESYVGKHKNLLIDLQGSVQVSRNRYLHLTTDLILKHAELTEYTPAVQDTTSINSIENTELNNLELNTNESSGSEINTSENNTESAITSPAHIITTNDGINKILTPIRTAKIDQKRRMRSDEIHYIDHPLLGVVIKVTPIELEQAVADEN